MRKLLASLLVAGALAGGATLASSAPAEAVSKKQLFYSTLDSESIPRAGAVKYAKSWCTSADKYGVSTSFLAYVSAAKDQDLDLHNMGYIIGAGASAFCPRHLSALNALT